MSRFVGPTGEHVKLDGAGFLLLQSEDLWWQSSEPTLRALDDLVADDASYVLLAAGGSGKTTAFKWLARTEPNAQYINLGSRSRGQQEHWLAKAIEAGGSVYLDGIDQAANTDPQLFPWLEEELTTPAACRVRWRLACRSAVWKSSLSARLRHELPSFSELTLQPMDRGTAATAFGTEFINAIAEAGMGRLSASPRQLSSTAAYWDKTGKLPVKPSEAIGYEIRKFLEETDENRSARLPAERVLRIAKRLAAFTTFGGANLFSASPTAIDGAISVRSLPADPEPDERSLTIEPQDYREVLDTNLFEAGQPGTVLFRHQQYEEFLAASFLVDRKITPEQIPALLGVHANGVLPTARIGIAAWLAALKPDLVEDLITDNALLLASTSLELTSDPVKASVVGALLDHAAKDEQQPTWGIDLRTLTYTGLSEHLELRLAKGPATSEEAWWIARLAEAGDCGRLSPALAELALSPTWRPYARRAAIAAVRELHDENALLALRTLLEREQSEDPDNEVLAAVVDALYPQFLSADELTRALRSGNSMSIGSYRLLLRDLTDKIPNGDLPFMARWLSKRPDEDASLDDMTIGVIGRIWPQADEVDSREALAALIVAVTRSGRWHRGHFQRTEVPWVVEDSVDRRRALAVAVAVLSGDAWYAPTESALLTPGDAHWLLDVLTTPGHRAATSLGSCLTQFLHTPPADLADRILELPETHPAYTVTSWWRGSKAVDSPDVARMRETVANQQRLAETLLVNEGLIRDEFTALVTRMNSEPELWWYAAQLLGTEANGDYSLTSEHDFTTRPRWATLADQHRHQFLEAGIRYLHVHEPAITAWQGANQIVLDDSMPDWSGVNLLTTLAVHAPNRLAELELSVWERWAEAIVAIWGLGTGTDLRPILFENLAEDALSLLRTAALTHLDVLNPNGSFTFQGAVYRHFAADLAPTISHGLASGRYSGELAGSLLDFLVEHGSTTAALALCTQLTQSTDTALASRGSLHLAALAPDRVVDDLVTTSHSMDEFAMLASRLDVSALNSAHLVTLTALLLDTYPYEADPPPRSGFTSRAEHDVRTVRDRALHRLADLCESEELARLRENQSSVDQQVISGHQRVARLRQADLALNTVAPEKLLGLLRSTDARLIRHDDDLLDVVVHALDHLQHRIAKTDEFRSIWDSTTSPKSEDSISDWIKARLSDRFKEIDANREVQVRRRKDAGIGDRSDLVITGPTLGGGLAHVMIEAKLVDNDQLMKAMRNQLVDQYLSPSGRGHGVYLVYWVRPDQRPDGWSKSKAADLATLRADLDRQAADMPSAMTVRCYVLDISRPN